MNKATVIMGNLPKELVGMFRVQKRALDDTVEALRRAIAASDQYKFISAMSKYPPTVSVDGQGAFVIDWTPRNESVITSISADRPKVLNQLDTTTLNVLLHSNLRSSSEKRRLAKTLLFDLADDNQPVKNTEAPTNPQS